jgi:hypothetical protein
MGIYSPSYSRSSQANVYHGPGCSATLERRKSTRVPNRDETRQGGVNENARPPKSVGVADERV